MIGPKGRQRRASSGQIDAPQLTGERLAIRFRELRIAVPTAVARDELASLLNDCQAIAREWRTHGEPAELASERIAGALAVLCAELPTSIAATEAALRRHASHAPGTDTRLVPILTRHLRATRELLTAVVAACNNPTLRAGYRDPRPVRNWAHVVTTLADGFAQALASVGRTPGLSNNGPLSRFLVKLAIPFVTGEGAGPMAATHDAVMRELQRRRVTKH